MPQKERNVLIVLFATLLISCGGSSDYFPKPKGYNRLDLPAHKYVQLEEKHPYTFEHNVNAIVEPDTFGNAEPHWIILHYKDLMARIQLTYKPLNGDLNKLSKHIDDAYKLAGRHHVKADSQVEKVIELKNGKRAVVIELEGEVPSHFQFYVTDTSKHYLRGAVYLIEPTLNDSLRPLVNYMKDDCMHLLETLKWTE
ncbi:gliding motility lipoprotein GldD [Arcticibacterium luteifluviistationis]|uniref:Gliding motility lipoprotein GldD n=1 Tax=Arcticibacterium luteifluviistationis TaxID=1784714 RepID=A0A2Z4GH34_9BACT|nr:gliding motility lipoprotein GldD [Arcticibacterium luteifluviistationis]AWW00611.1 gliding motility lipoprotein GldD [Arcticibacterium luteifluviistationis]